MIGQTISHYRILEKLGEGGMGVVYKAHDTELDRDVALKFLPHHITINEAEQARFLQEARAAAVLNHPNICTVHAIEKADDQQFIVMEYVEGKTLRQLIPTQKTQIAIDYAIQIGDALQEAHSKGIVHRDVKADNIMVNSKNQIKVMDFGLAKLKGSLKLTKTSSTVGTLAYMAPEQIQGGEVDARSDIFSFGVVMFEMLTGHLPFRGEHEAAMMYSIMNEEPLTISSFRKDVPPYLQSLIGKALEKDRSCRYQTCQELVSDLKKQQTTRYMPTQEKSIVVLPFENISPDKENEYFSDGLTEEIIADLSKLSSLRVISRTSAMILKGTKKDIKTIGRELNVGYVLEGSVRKAADKLRITAQLIDASTDAHIWAEKFNGVLDDVFGIQESVSRAVVDALRITLTHDEQKRIGERHIDNPLAYDYYLKARREWSVMNIQSFERAEKYLNDGLEIVGPNAVIYGGMAYVYWNYANVGLDRGENLKKAEQYVHKAFELDPDSPQANLVMGLICWFTDLKKCVGHLERDVEFNPNDIDGLMWLSSLYMTIGKVSQARHYADRLMRIDPLGSLSTAFPGFLSYFGGDFAQALESLAKGYAMDPTNGIIRLNYPLMLAYNQMFSKAKAHIDQYGIERFEGFDAYTMLLRYALDRDISGMRKIMTPVFESDNKRDFQMSCTIAAICSMAGLDEESLDWLENSVEHGNYNYRFIGEYDPFFKKFRDNERFKRLVQKAKKGFEEFGE